MGKNVNDCVEIRKSGKHCEIAATSYDIVTGCGDEGLPDMETAVKKSMQDGWQPVGGIEIHIVNDGKCYYQAMVK